MFNRFAVLLSLVVAFSAVPAAQADVRLPSIIGEGMVLQQGMEAPIWGWAEAGEKVTVSFAGKTKSATADDKGKWIVKLDAMKASARGRTLKIKGKNTISVAHVLVGEVWICSGQWRTEPYSPSARGR